MATRNKILTDLFNNPDVHNAIKRLARGKAMDFENELRSCTFLCLCEMDEHLIQDLYLDGELTKYACAVVRNMAVFTGGGSVKSIIDYVPDRVNNNIETPNGPVYLMDILVDQSDSPTANLEKEDAIKMVNQAVGGLNYFERLIFDSYMKHGTIARAAEDTKTDARWVRKTLMAAKRKIVKYVGDN